MYIHIYMHTYTQWHVLGIGDHGSQWYFSRLLVNHQVLGSEAKAKPWDKLRLGDIKMYHINAILC